MSVEEPKKTWNFEAAWKMAAQVPLDIKRGWLPILNLVLFLSPSDQKDFFSALRMQTGEVDGSYERAVWDEWTTNEKGE